MEWLCLVLPLLLVFVWFIAIPAFAGAGHSQEPRRDRQVESRRLDAQLDRQQTTYARRVQEREIAQADHLRAQRVTVQERERLTRAEAKAAATQRRVKGEK